MTQNCQFPADDLPPTYPGIANVSNTEKPNPGRRKKKAANKKFPVFLGIEQVKISENRNLKKT